VRELEWCRACCTAHAADQPCPGELLATGPERHAWRVTVDTPHGMETFGVLVAPAGSLWRARVVTYPRTLWVVPGGAGSMKFAATRPQEAERQAIELIEELCDRRGFRKHEVLPPVEIGPIDPERARAPRRAPPSPSARKPLRTPVHFGHTRPSLQAETANVSERGMFVSTPSPLQAGAAIRMRVILDAFTVPLRGVVVWCRTTPEPGRPLGMGVRIFQPSGLYTDFVSHLQEKRGPDGPRRRETIKNDGRVPEAAKKDPSGG